MEIINELALALGASVDDTLAKLLTIAVAISGVALFAQVILDVIKFYLQPKVDFHHHQLLKFINTNLEGRVQVQDGDQDQDHAYAQDILCQLIRLSAAGNCDTFYAQSHTDITKAIKRSVSLHLQELENFPDKEGAEVWSMRRFVQAWCPEDLKEALDTRAELVLEKFKEKPDAKKITRLTQLENYLTLVNEGSLLGLELQLSRSWTLLMTSASSFVSFVLTFSLGLSTGLSQELSAPIATWLLFATLVAVLAPFSHDLVSSLLKATGRPRGSKL